MYAALLASDAAYDGCFVTGVLSTGIYCLPSCRARKPKRENVRFFSNFEEARAAGLRACRKCRPEEFESGHYSELDRLEAAVHQMRSTPGAYARVPEFAAEFGWGTTKLQEAARRHYHASPSDLVARAQIARACSLIYSGDLTVAEVGMEVGFDSASGFNAAFREQTGLAPSEFRALRSAETFEISLPSGYNLEPLRARILRDSDEVIESFDGELYRRALYVGGEPAVLQMRFGDGVIVSVDGLSASMREVHAIASRILGLGQEVRGFEAVWHRTTGQPVLHIGTRIPQTPTIFDGVVWAVVGQQVTLSFARTLRRRLAENFGQSVNGLKTLPEPSSLATRTVEDLLPLQFSRRKAEYLVGLASLGDEWWERLRVLPATRVESLLLAQRGLGVWSANYLMMRSLGFADCVPLGDTGLASGLRKLHGLDYTPKVDEQKKLMEPFAPYRSLATFHLWQSLKDSA